jgi:hypothetical protein
MEDNKTTTELNKRELKMNELEQVTGGAHKPSYYVGPHIYNKAPNDTNQMPRGMQESAVVEQYSPLP